MALPIRFQEIAKLSNLGIDAQFCNFKGLTLESDRFVCVRETLPDASNVVIVDLQDLSSPPVRRKMSADSAIMNPTTKVLALKAGRQLQIFNLEMKTNMKSHVLDQDVVFWRWISVKTIAVVTTTAVYHWGMEGDSKPRKVFDRHDTLTGVQVITYRVDKDEKWLCLVGIAVQDGRIVGKMQLFNTEKNQSQAIEGHACSFGSMTCEGASSSSTFFIFANRAADAAHLNIIEVEKGTGSQFMKKKVDLRFPADAPNDFPVSLQFSEKYGVVYVLTKMGYFQMYDIETGAVLYMNRISSDVIFISTNYTETDGIMLVNQGSQVLAISIDDNNIVPYVSNQLGNLDVAIKLASRADLAGADDLVIKQFNSLFQQQRFTEAARVAATSPRSILRTPQTIQRFQQVPLMAGQTSPLLQYFSILLEQGKLNQLESIELTRPVMAQNRKELLEKWLTDDKLEASEELGDMLKPMDVKLALSVYLRANIPNKVIACFAETGQYDSIVTYSKKVDFKPDYAFLLSNILRVAPQNGVQFALLLAKDSDGPLLAVNSIVEAFLQRNKVQEATAFLLEILKEDKEEDNDLKTRLLEINLMTFPQVADAILTSKQFTGYNRSHIAELCEKAGLMQHALDHFTEISDIKRVLVALPMQTIDINWVLAFFGELSVENSLECLRELLASNMRQNLQVVVQVAAKYAEHLTTAALITMFESFKSYDGLFYFLNNIVDFSQDADVHFKYIVAATKTNQTKEVERICKDSACIDPVRTRDFLKEAKLPDQLPLIIICDRFDMIGDLTHYLYSNQMTKFIEVYVQKVNPQRTPQVIAALIDADASDDFIKNLIMSVRASCPVEALVNEVEQRSRLKLLLPFLEQRAQEGNTEPATHNALAKVYIDTNNNAEAFLTTNAHYESDVVGRYCEKRDPFLAFVAYKRGQCDTALVEVCRSSSLFKPLARYVVERQDAELWAFVLQEDPTRRSIVDHVVGTALPETTDSDAVSAAVKAFMVAELPNELIALLEKIVLAGGQFHANTNLQNLLILTAIKADQTRVMDYINQLDGYDGAAIANIALSHGLHEEAHHIYSRNKMNVPAVNVLIEKIESLTRAADFADKVDETAVWSSLAKAQLQTGEVALAVASYLKADDHANYTEVIERASAVGAWTELVSFLEMARKKTREPIIDGELVVALATIDRLDDLEELISLPNVAQLDAVGERLFSAELFRAARLVFATINANSRLASTLIRLNEFSAAVDAARKANLVRTWKEVNHACIDAQEFRLAQICGLHIVVEPEELEGLMSFYEERNHINDLMTLLEAGLGLERAHKALFTELAVFYCRHRPDKLMEHLKLFWSRMNIPKVIRACEAGHLWREAVHLHVKDEEPEEACRTMIEHAGSAWDASTFKDIVTKISNPVLLDEAVVFFLSNYPTDLCDLLTTINAKADQTRVVNLLRSKDGLPLAKRYLETIQNANVQAVNDALNTLYIEEEDYSSLRTSIETYDSFDALSLAKQLESHAQLQFRRIAAFLYAQNNRWKQSVALSKADGHYQDAMETVAKSQDKVLVEELLRFFLEEAKDKACFAACLLTCYPLIAADKALELAWSHGCMDVAMPFMIQSLRDLNTKVDRLEASQAEAAKVHEEEVQQQQQQQQEIQYASTGPATPYDQQQQQMLMMQQQQQQQMMMQQQQQQQMIQQQSQQQQPSQEQWWGQQ